MFSRLNSRLLPEINIALDSMTGYGSEITRRRKEKLFDSRSYHSMTPMILNSIKYTDDKRYRNVIINRPLDVIKTIFLTILPEYGSSNGWNAVNM